MTASMADGPGRLWAIVLAGGNGRRVAALTLDEAGLAVPKQYCRFGRATPMLRWALERARRSVGDGRVVTVVAQHHQKFWERELVGAAPDDVLVQPQDRGTAPGLLLPLLNVLRRDPAARVLVLPSDHYVADEAAFACAVESAWSTVAEGVGRVILLGMTPAEPLGDCGWIQRASGAGPALSRVSAFVEKPGPEGARRLMRLGALVNAFILVASAGALLRLYADTLPYLVREFSRRPAAVVDPDERARVYERLPTADFSRDVLERVPRSLWVLAMPDCGWCDLGTPERLGRFLDQVERR
jgi:mannose-1-phosphate guanylyltransferase